MSGRMFDIAEGDVIEAAACTWCGVGVGESCRRPDWGRWVPEATHAQRWRDFWNETHDASEGVAVFPNPKREASR